MKKITRLEFAERLLNVRKAAPIHSPLASFCNAHPEYDSKAKAWAKVRNVWYGFTNDLVILEKFEKLFLKK